MKKNAFIAFCAATFLMASCVGEDTTESNDESGEKEEQEMTVESVSYTLDKEESSLTWKGTEGEHEFHVGTIDFSEGNLVMQGDAVESGSFVVDMTTIAVTDEGMPDKYKNKLQGHLGAEDVFNVAQFANTTVTLGEYKEGMLDVTLSVLGKEVKSSIAVSVNADEQGAKISGPFSIDLSSVGIPLFEPQEEEDESISPVIEFRLNAILTKK